MMYARLNLADETKRAIRKQRTLAPPEVLIDFVDRLAAGYSPVPVKPFGDEVKWCKALYALTDPRG